MTDITIQQLMIFPLKSAKGIQLQESNYSQTGLDYDRNWMIVDEQTRTFLTARTIGKMVLIETAIDFEAGLLHITVPAHKDEPSSTHSISLSIPTDPLVHETDFSIWGGNFDGYIVESIVPGLTEALSSFMGRSVLVVQKGNELREGGPEIGWIGDNMIGETEYEEPSSIKFNDQFPILLVSQKSFEFINRKIENDQEVRGMKGFDESRWGKGKQGLEVERYRGNIIIQGCQEEFEEEGWGSLEFQSVGHEKETIYVAARCARCMLPNVSPETGIRDKVVPHSVLYPWRNTWSLMPEKTVMGCNLVPRSTHGTLRVGDKVTVTSRYPKSGTNFLRPEDEKLGA